MSFTGNMPATLFWECLLRIFLAALCGLVIGFERKARLKEAGVRTHLIVALGAALITIVSKYGFFDLALFAEGIKADPTRIAAQIVSGVGFLGAGMIFMRHRTLTGLTTAAGIWTTAGIGMAVGCGLYAVSLFSTALVVLTQLMLHRDYRWTRAPGCTAVCLRTQPGPSGLRQALAALDEMQVQVINRALRAFCAAAARPCAGAPGRAIGGTGRSYLRGYIKGEAAHAYDRIWK